MQGMLKHWGQRLTILVLVMLGLSLVQAQSNAPIRGRARDGTLQVTERTVLPAYRAFARTSTTSNSTILSIDQASLAAARGTQGKFRVTGFPLNAVKRVDLVLEPFLVVGPKSKFVLGRVDGEDIPFPYDASRFQFFRGRVAGRVGSSVFLAIHDELSTGYVDLGTGEPRYRISSRGSDGEPLGASRVSVFATRAGGLGGPAGVPLCGVVGDRLMAHGELIESPASVVRSGSVAGSTPRVGLRQMELAVETDYEYFLLHGDPTAAFDYIVAMYGEVSAIYMRDVDMRIEVVFARIWTTPNDLFDGPQPLFQFYPYWIKHMGAVQRDTAQLFSGRRNYPFGGQAFLSQLCGTFGYGIVGYAVGFFPDPTKPDPFNWDVSVSAHELGHSSGATHTHDDVDLDSCDLGNTTPQRGSIMSYCGQTWSGMNANTDNYFHRVIQVQMDDHIAVSSCLIPDCNTNSVHDTTDISSGTSMDANGNGVPDECEDCNANGVLDPADISGGMPDINGNGIPDECEPDCNNNGSPDERDIRFNISTDLTGNGIPDECEEDCNNNGISDLTEIQADMTRDKNRDAILDACQDCDSNGQTDLDELIGAHSLWAASGQSNSILREFLGETGVVLRTSTGGTVAELRGGQDLIAVGAWPNTRILVSSLGDARVVEFDVNGVYVRDLVPILSGGLTSPTGLLMTAGGFLLVAHRDGDEVLSYNGATGAFTGVAIASGLGGLSGPFGMTFGPNGNLFVTSSTNEVIEFDLGNGTYVRTLVKATDNGGLDQPRGLVFKPDGNLLVASFGTDEVLEYDGGTGRPRGKWAQVGTATRITQDSPWGIRIGPNGHVFVSRTGSAFSSSPSSDNDNQDNNDDSLTIVASHLTDASMFEYDVCTGGFRRTLIGGNDHGLEFATGFDFIPGFDIDCNQNYLQDACDIAAGTSADTDDNGVPDECQIDCNNNGVYDHLDIWPRGSSMDCNCNFVPDECDLATTSQDCNQNGVPDECELDFDCDGNSVQDICQIFEGQGDDCDENGLLDVCETGNAGVLLDVDFESGLPTDWEALGLFHVSSSCDVAPTCGGNSWAYAGDSGSCTYGDGDAGGLMSPPIDLPFGSSELQFCHALNTEADFDFADVTVNNVRVFRASGNSGGWVNEVIDLTQFEGQSIRIVFRMQSDPSVSGTLGWQVDNVRIVTLEGDDCNDNGIPDSCEPDVDCNENMTQDICDIASGFSLDLNNNGIPDECDLCTPVEAPLADSEGAKPRYVSFRSINVDELEGIRVVLQSLPAPFDVYNGTQMWVGEPRVISDNSGIIEPNVPPLWPTTAVASLQCDPVFTNFAAFDKVHVWDRLIVPEAVYSLQAINSFCNIDNESEFSAPLAVSTSIWGDVVKDCTTSPCGPPDGSVDVVTDVTAILEKFANLANAPAKVRVDLEPEIVDHQINMSDVLFALDAFSGDLYPFAVAGAPPCP